jgi:hypothetical protein
MKKMLLIFVMFVFLTMLFVTMVHATDFDGDGIPDEWERKNGLKIDVNDANEDPDQDGLINVEEYRLGTDPNSADTDGDSIADNLDKDPLNPSSPFTFNWFYLFAIPVCVLLFFIIYYLVNIEYGKITSHQKTIQNPKQFTFNPMTNRKPAMVNYRTQVRSTPINPIQKSKQREALLNKFSDSEQKEPQKLVLKPESANNEKKSTGDSFKKLEGLSKTESSLDKLKRMVKKK